MQIARPRSLSEEVTLKLRTEIIEGQFELGEALSETMIATRYGVSRTPVREAFAFLGLEGVLRTEPQQGTYIFTITRDQFNQLSETRSILEVGALRLALNRNRKKLITGWGRIVQKMERAAKREEYVKYSRLDGDFHDLMFDLAQNPHLIEATQSFSTKVAAVRHRLGGNKAHIAQSLGEHIELLQFVEDDRTNSATELLDHHIRFKGETFWAAAGDHIATDSGPSEPSTFIRPKLNSR